MKPIWPKETVWNLLIFLKGSDFFFSQAEDLVNHCTALLSQQIVMKNNVPAVEHLIKRYSH